MTLQKQITTVAGLTLALVLLICGSSQLFAGSATPSFKVTDSKRTVGLKVYESTNHLRSVAVTYSDKKQAVQVSGVLQQANVEVESWQDLYAYGSGCNGRTVSASSYRYAYQGSEKDDEDMGEGNSYTTHYRQLDPRAGRWTSIDPKATAWESPYASMGCNPIFNNDVMGDTVRGVSAKSATRTRDAMHEAFQGASNKQFRDLIKIEGDGVTMSAINEDDFAKAVAFMTADQQALAYSYYTVINSTDQHLVEALAMGEAISAHALGLMGQSGVGINNTNELRDKAGGGLNMSGPGIRGTYTIITTNLAPLGTNNNVDQFNQCSFVQMSCGETFGHEVIGHGHGALTGSAGASHIDALQMSNLQRRVLGTTAYRDGSSHGNLVILSRQEATGLPPAATIPQALAWKITTERLIIESERKMQEVIKDQQADFIMDGLDR